MIPEGQVGRNKIGLFLYTVSECIRKYLRSMTPMVQAKGVQVDPCVVVVLKSMLS